LAGPTTSVGICPRGASDQIPLKQDRVRRVDQLQLPQPDPWEPVKEDNQQCAVRALDPRSVDLSVQDRELMAHNQDLDVLVSAAHRQQT
jgi:hypothetical protein